MIEGKLNGEVCLATGAEAKVFIPVEKLFRNRLKRCNIGSVLAVVLGTFLVFVTALRVA